MSIRDTDLRDALEPLAGDPVRDAARVLRELPAPGIKGLAWWLLGAGLLVAGLAGGLVGYLVAASTGEVAPPPAESPAERPGDGAEKDEKDEKDVKSPMPMERYEILFFGLGNVSVVEPGQERATLNGEHGLPFGVKFDTGADAQAGMWLTGEVLVRLDMDTVMSIAESRRLELTKGRAWVRAAGDGELVVVSTPHGLVDITEGAVIVESTDEAVRVVCLEGDAMVRREGVAPLTVDQGKIAAVGDAVREPPSDAGFLARHTSWMTRMLVLQRDASELEKRARRMVEHYFRGEYRSEATREIRRMGGACVPMLVQNLTERTDLDPGLVRETAELITAIADVSNLPNLFTLLYHMEPEVRVTVYTEVYRMTGENAGTGDGFWRDQADRREREKVIQEWWKKVK